MEAVRKAFLQAVIDQGLTANEAVLVAGAIAGTIVASHVAPDTAYLNFTHQMSDSVQRLSIAIGCPIRMQVMEVHKGGKK